MDDTTLSPWETAAFFAGTILGGLMGLGLAHLMTGTGTAGAVASGCAAVACALQGSLAGLGAWQRAASLLGLAGMRAA